MRVGRQIPEVVDSNTRLITLMKYCVILRYLTYILLVTYSGEHHNQPGADFCLFLAAKISPHCPPPILMHEKLSEESRRNVMMELMGPET